MRSQRVYFELADTTDERFDPLIEGLLVALLAFAPLALGAVQTWSEAVVVALSAGMLLALLMKLAYRPDARFVWSIAYVPIIGFMLLVLFQLVPLPAGMIRVISPHTFALRKELLESLPDGANQIRWMTISFYPDATISQLRLLLSACAVFVVTLNVVRRLGQVRRMLAAISVVAAIVAVLALMQDLTDATRIYWLIPIYNNDARSGPFINHSHYAQFMNMSMGAAIGLLLMNLDQLPRHRRHESSRAAALARPLTWPIRLLACGLVAMAVTVPLALSRGGMLSMLVAGIFTAIILATRRGMKGRTWIFIAMAVAIFAAMLLIEWDVVLGRATSVADPQALDGRIDILRGTVQIWKWFPVFGTGLGTFEFVFPPFDPSMIPKIAEHAENEYAQVLVETGAIGLVLTIGFIVIVWIAYARCVRGAPSPMASAAIGLGCGFAAILVHSASDFGQHIPANFMLTAVICGLLVTLSQASRHVHAVAHQLPHRAARWPRLVGAALALSAAGWLVVDSIQSWRADRHARAARRIAAGLEAQPSPASDIEYARLILAAESARDLRPRNATYSYELNLYRWKALARNLSSQSQQPALPERDLADARRIVSEMLSGAWRCPTYAPHYILSGQIVRYVLREPGGEELIRTSYRLTPANPRTCIAVARLEGEHGRWDAALSAARRTVAMGADYRFEAIETMAAELNRPDLALQLADNDLESLRDLSRILERTKTAPDVAATARARMEALVQERADRPDAASHMLVEAARLCVRRSDIPRAIELYRRALSAEYSRFDWRIELAGTLLAAGKREDALHEARTVLRLAPGNQGAARMIADLAPAASSRPATVPLPSTLPTTAPGFKFE